MSLTGTPTLHPVTIASFSQHCAAWHLVNGEDLLPYSTQPAEDRGENIVLPGFDGRLGQDFHFDEQTVELRYLFDGNENAFGTPHDDVITGLALNKRAFRTAVFRADRDAYGTVAVTVEDVDGAEFAGRVQLRRLRFGEGLTACTAVMTVVLPAELEETGS